jgi:hypothetical protein
MMSYPTVVCLRLFAAADAGVRGTRLLYAIRRRRDLTLRFKLAPNPSDLTPTAKWIAGFRNFCIEGLKYGRARLNGDSIEKPVLSLSGVLL